MKKRLQSPLTDGELLRKKLAEILGTYRRLLTRAKPQAISSAAMKPKDWVTRIEQEKQGLLAFVYEIENEFIRNGESLNELVTRLAATEGECEKLTELTIGEVQDSAVQFAFQLLKKAEDLVLASYEQYEEVFKAFEILQEKLAQLPKQHEELMQVLLPLNFITTAFRIEASRHPPEVQGVFATLSGEVARTVNEVRVTLDRHFKELAESEQIVARLMSEVQQCVKKHRAAMSSTLQNSRMHLNQLSDMLTQAGAGVATLKGLNQAVSGHIVSIVMAQQCQDIARQNIEHIGQAMDEIVVHLCTDSSGAAEAELGARHFASKTATIQLEQVRIVFQTLNEAAGSLTMGIQNLKADASVTAEAAVQIGGMIQESKATQQCEESIDEILSIIRASVTITRDILAAFEPLQRKFDNCTNQATELASDVRYAALNAQIFAIHVENGATLEVLAARTWAISDETVQHGQQLGATLKRTAETINNLRQSLADFQVMGMKEQEILTEEAVLSSSRLKQLDEKIPKQIQTIVLQQKEFTQSVEAVLAMVHFPEKVAQASAHSITFFEELIAWGSDAPAPALTPSSSLHKIEKLKSNYTMESERLAHEAALAASVETSQKGLEGTEEAATKPAVKKEEPNNVELF